MKKKYISNLKIKKILPLPLYFLKQSESVASLPITKFEKASGVNAEGFELYNFYKPISKF